MHTVMWTFPVPSGTSKDDLVNTIDASAHTYQGIPGLIRKYYGIAEDGQSLVGIYLWKTKEEAEAFYTPQWVKLVTERWKAPPRKREWMTPMVVESEKKTLVRAKSLAPAPKKVK